jgi:NAD(P)-dependent dehydrogenase (short-subunit alcohol dehydrogenase family)
VSLAAGTGEIMNFMGEVAIIIGGSSGPGKEAAKGGTR